MRVALILLVLLAGCGPGAGRCTVVTKGYPLCGL